MKDLKYNEKEINRLANEYTLEGLTELYEDISTADNLTDSDFILLERIEKAMAISL